MNKYFFCIKIENIIIHDLAENKQNLVIIMQIPNINNNYKYAHKNGGRRMREEVV